MSIALKGGRQFVDSRWNITDACALGIAGPLLIAAVAGVEPRMFGAVANVILFARLAWTLSAGRMLLLMLQRVAPPMLYMSVLVGFAMYFFAVIGLEAFHGRTPDPPDDAYFYE